MSGAPDTNRPDAQVLAGWSFRDWDTIEWCDYCGRGFDLFAPGLSHREWRVKMLAFKREHRAACRASQPEAERA